MVSWVHLLVAIEVLVEAPAVHHHPLSVARHVDVGPELDPGIAYCGSVDVQVPVNQPAGCVVSIPCLVHVQHVVAVVFDPPVEGVGLVQGQVCEVPGHVVGPVLEAHAVAHLAGSYLKLEVTRVDAGRVDLVRVALDGPGALVEHVHVDVQVSAYGACPLGYRHVDLDVVRLLGWGEVAPVPTL